MNGPIHQIAGAVAGIVITATDTPNKESFVYYPALSGVVGAMVGKLPDLLEPAYKNPHHRQFYHSFTVLGLVAWGTYKAHEWETHDDVEKFIRGLALVGGVAYTSHLILDALTHRSLPIVGRI